MKKVILILIACAMLITSVSAEVLTNYSGTQVAPSMYIPWEYVAVVALIGIVCLIASQMFEDIRVILGMISTMAFVFCTWGAGSMAVISSFTVIDQLTGESEVHLMTAATPQPMLQLLFGVLFLFSLVLTGYMWFGNLTPEKSPDEDSGGLRPVYYRRE